MRFYTRVNMSMRIHEILYEAAAIPLFWHGTTSRHEANIMRDGLLPQPNPGGAFRGNASTISGWTEHHVYLTPSKEIALSVARAQTRVQGGSPIVFAVRVRDSSKLFVDDDYINQVGHANALAYIRSGFDANLLPNSHEPDDTVEQAFRRDAMSHPWENSLKSVPGRRWASVAHRGPIPASDLIRIPDHAWTLEG